MKYFFDQRFVKQTQLHQIKYQHTRISKVSNLIFEKLISSKIITNIKENPETNKFCNKAIKKGKSKYSNYFTNIYNMKSPK